MLPVEVVFQKLRRSEAAEHRIRAKAEELEAVYPRLTSCRVLVDVPHRHRTGGKRFRVRIDLGLPGRDDLVIERGPAGKGVPADVDRPVRRKADELDGAFTDLAVVVQEAFDAARRRLQDLARRRRDVARTTAARRSPRATAS